MPTTTYRFALSISSEDYLAYYQGLAKSVSVIAQNGQRIEFPARYLQPYLLHDGIHGRFVMIVDANNKLVSLQKSEI